MSHQTTSSVPESTVRWETLEAWPRLRIQSIIQVLLEEEVTVLLGRRKSERWRVAPRRCRIIRALTTSPAAS